MNATRVTVSYQAIIMTAKAQVISYSGEPLIHACRVEMAYLHTTVKNVYPQLFLTLITLLCWAGVTLKKQKTVKNAHTFAVIANQNSH